MAQLKEDEWPQDDEPTTSEEENAAFNREGPNPPGRKTGHSIDEMNRAGDEAVITNVEPDQQVD
jgi:hypothetical protein